jgi:uncharacterized alpha-E superfamily protein
MIFDPTNPRSLLYQLDRLKKNLSNLPNVSDQNLSAHEILITEAYSLLKQTNKEKLSVLDIEAGQHINLDEFLSAMYDLLSGIQNAVSKTYFKHAESQKQLFSTDQTGENLGE